MMHLPQLSYLGVVSQPEYYEYGFKVTYFDRSSRVLTLAIAHSVFLTKQLMVQEGPDLCYQKILADLKNESLALTAECTSITEADILQYRESHPNIKLQRKSFRKPVE